MASAAWIAARNAMLAGLQKAHVSMRDDVANPAINKLNEHTGAGDIALAPVANSLTPVVLALNAYRPILLKTISDTNAMQPDDVPQGALWFAYALPVTAWGVKRGKNISSIVLKRR